MAEKEAAQVAKRRARDEAAAQMERQKAKDAMERQQKVAAAAAAVVVPKIVAAPAKAEPVAKADVEPVAAKKTPVAPEKAAFDPFSIFGGAKPAEKKVAPAKPVSEKKGKTVVPFASFLETVSTRHVDFAFFAEQRAPFRYADPIVPVAPVIKPVVPVAAKKVEPKADVFASIFGAKPDVKKVVPAKPDPVVPIAPVVKPVEPVAAKKVEPVADVFASFFGAKPDVKKVVSAKPVVETKGE